MGRFIILTKGANVNCKKPIYNTTPLTIASRSGFKSISSVLCEFKADVKSLDGYGASTFHWIADSNEAGILKYIFSRIKDGKSDIKKILNHRDGYGSTALHFASVRGNFDVVKELVECGADSMLLNNDGKRASQVTNDPECKSFLEFEEERILKLKRQLAEGGLAGKLTKKLKTNGIKRIKKKVVK